MIDGFLAQRFWAQVDRETSPHSWNGTRCWDWTGKRNPYGYGTIYFEGETYSSCRFFWMHIFGRKCLMKDVHHRCRNKLCIRPDHLQALTHSEHAAVRRWLKLSPEQRRSLKRKERD